MGVVTLKRSFRDQAPSRSASSAGELGARHRSARPLPTFLSAKVVTLDLSHVSPVSPLTSPRHPSLFLGKK
jgi:hypothetical protein